MVLKNAAGFIRSLITYVQLASSYLEALPSKHPECTIDSFNNFKHQTMTLQIIYNLVADMTSVTTN